jgi:exopolysaccharide biosynthesis polyprenyl glycosylphosphotransferase
MTTTSFEEIQGEQRSLAAAPALPQIEAALRRRDRFFGTALRAAVVFLPTVAILVSFGYGLGALADGAVLAAIWLFTLRSARSETTLSQLALGPFASTALGAMAGLAAASAVAFWTPGLGVGPAQLLLVSLAIFAATLAFEGVASKKVSPRGRVLVVGLGGGGRDLVRDLADDPGSPFECIGVVSSESEAELADDMPVLGTTAALKDVLLRERPDLVVLASTERRSEALATVLDAASLEFRVVDLHHFYEHAFGRVPVGNLSPVWFMSLLHLYQRPYPRAVKRVLDVSLAALGLLIAAPLFPLVAWLVRRSSPGPLLFRQIRLGEGGKTFQMLKFRTMVDGAERPGTPVWAGVMDPRITRVGHFLRKTRIDELPQLWNVLRGDMSVVGPRPERPEFVGLLEREVPFWTRRHLVKPGITGWAQVRRGYTSDLEGTAEKLSYDLYYLKHRSVALDLAIVAKTIAIVASRSERPDVHPSLSAQA